MVYVCDRYGIYIFAYIIIWTVCNSYGPLARTIAEIEYKKYQAMGYIYSLRVLCSCLMIRSSRKQLWWQLMLQRYPNPFLYAN